MRRSLHLSLLALGFGLSSSLALWAQDSTSGSASTSTETQANLSTDSPGNSLASPPASQSASTTAGADTETQSSTNLGGNAQADSSLNSNLNSSAQSNFNSNSSSQSDLDSNRSSQGGFDSSSSNQGNLNSNSWSQDNPGSGQTADGNDSWRYREYQGRQWYWQGDRPTGSWMYLSNGTWTPFQAQANAQGNAMGQVRVSGYRGSGNNQYDGPFYFDTAGRRYILNGNTYAPDQNWNDQFYNDDYQNSYRSYRSNYGSSNYNNFDSSSSVRAGGNLNAPGTSGYGQSGVSGNSTAYPNANNVGGAVGQSFSGQSGARIGAGVDSAIRGGPGSSQNIGGGVGQAIGGQAGGRAGAAIGGAIGQDR
jgi:hypothetical protein